MARDKANVWLGITSDKLYGPFIFAEPTATGTIYLGMLQPFLHPHLVKGGIVETVMFQQDGAPPHYAIVVHPNRWIGRASQRLCTPRLPDITPLDCLLDGI